MNTMGYCCCYCLIIGLFNLSSPSPVLATPSIWLPQASTRVLTIAQSLIAELPPEPSSASTRIQQAVFQDLSQRTRQPTHTFEMIRMEPQTWPDGCLGLPEPDVLCTMVLVPGWRVVVSDGSQEWTYRTDDLGQIVKLDSGQ